MLDTPFGSVQIDNLEIPLSDEVQSFHLIVLPNQDFSVRENVLFKS
jgi:hypothetical protein